MRETWTRVSLVSEDYYDVEEDVSTVRRLIETAEDSGLKFVGLQSVVGGVIYIRVDQIESFYEHGIEYLKEHWERAEYLENLKKETAPEW